MIGYILSLYGRSRFKYIMSVFKSTLMNIFKKIIFYIRISEQSKKQKKNNVLWKVICTKKPFQPKILSY
jgi:hypothetical protein